MCGRKGVPLGPEKKNSIDVIYLDFQKAFDTVPHRRLLQKLTSFGIHGNVLKWIESFLSNTLIKQLCYIDIIC